MSKRDTSILSDETRDHYTRLHQADKEAKARGNLDKADGQTMWARRALKEDKEAREDKANREHNKAWLKERKYNAGIIKRHRHLHEDDDYDSD